MKAVGTFLSRVFPNLEYFNFREAAIYADPLTGDAVQRALFVFMAWLVILLVGSVWIFDRRDFI